MEFPQIGIGNPCSAEAYSIWGVILKIGGCNFHLMESPKISCLPVARQLIVAEAIKGDYTHLLFLDDDMKFSPEAFNSLQSRDVSFIGANYMIRGGESSVTYVKGIITTTMHLNISPILGTMLIPSSRQCNQS